MSTQKQPELVTVFGGSGFLGRHVVRALARRGYRIRVAVRRPDLAGHLQPLGGVGQIVAVQANLRNRDSVDRAVVGADHVVNCVGILFETGRNTFNSVQDFGARAVAEAVRAAGIGLTHISAIGADPLSASEYASSKGRAEVAIVKVLPDAIIMRPSIIFGPEDGFFNKFAEMARFFPALPLVGGGKTRFQPVYVGNVAEAVARSVDGQLDAGSIYELGGPRVMSFRQCLEEMFEVIHRRCSFVALPWALASLIGKTLALVPFIEPPLTADQVTLLKADNVVSPKAISENRTLAGIGVPQTTVEAILPSYLGRYRPQGQYSGTGNEA